MDQRQSADDTQRTKGLAAARHDTFRCDLGEGANVLQQVIVEQLRLSFRSEHDIPFDSLRLVHRLGLDCTLARARRDEAHVDASRLREGGCDVLSDATLK